MSKEILFVYRPRSEWHRRWDLTPEKVYTCWWDDEMLYSSNGLYYRLINDMGKEIEVHEGHLVLLQKVRAEKLDNLI